MKQMKWEMVSVMGLLEWSVEGFCVQKLEFTYWHT